jgi:Xaa-Pro aminopeptidase
MLPLPNDAADVEFVEWAEDEDPYSKAMSILPNEGLKTIFVDNSIRKFIVDGLQRVDPNAKVYSAPLEITQMRERKSEAELEILRCVNEVWCAFHIIFCCLAVEEFCTTNTYMCTCNFQATLLAMREVHKKLYFGIRESEAQRMMAEALSAAGFQEGGCLTLFGGMFDSSSLLLFYTEEKSTLDNAALPHGGGTDKTLGKADFALFDCGASLHGYYSDVTRVGGHIVAVYDND